MKVKPLDPLLPPLDGDDKVATGEGHSAHDDLMQMLTCPAATGGTGSDAHDGLMAMLLAEPPPNNNGSAAEECEADNVVNDTEPPIARGFVNTGHRRHRSPEEDEEEAKGRRTEGFRRKSEENDEEDEAREHITEGAHSDGRYQPDIQSGSKEAPKLGMKPEVVSDDQPPLPFSGSVADIGEDSKKAETGSKKEVKDTLDKNGANPNRATVLAEKEPELLDGEEPPLPILPRVTDADEDGKSNEESKERPILDKVAGSDDSGLDSAASGSEAGYSAPSDPAADSKGKCSTSKKIEALKGGALTTSTHSEIKDTVYSAEDILKILPHTPPFLFVDKVIEFEAGKRAVGIKSISCNEPLLVGHFPGRPIMPNILQLEALAQLAGIVLIVDEDAPPSRLAGSNQIVFLSGVSNIKWHRMVLPGDTMVLEVEILNWNPMFGSASVAGRANVDGEMVVEVQQMSITLAK